MINWRTCIGLSLLLMAAVELLKIKDNYHPATITSLVIWLSVAFTLSVLTATFLIFTGLRPHWRPRRKSRKNVSPRPKEIPAHDGRVRTVPTSA